MKQYVLYSQVQRKLTEHAAATGTPYSFYDAVWELWEAEEYQSAPELPAAPFEDWDVDDLDQFADLYGQVPVDLDIFTPGFQRAQNASDATRHNVEPDTMPMLIAQDQAMGLHAHDAFELLYVLRGEALLHCGQNRYNLPAGTLCVLAPRTLHDAISGEGCLLLNLGLAEKNVDDTLYKLLRQQNVLADFVRASLGGERGNYLMFSIPESRQFRLILQALLHEYFCWDEYSKDLSIACLEMLFGNVLRHGSAYSEQRQFDPHYRGNGAILAVLRHIQANFRTTSLEETAALFHYEPSYLGKRLRQVTGKNYTKLIQDLRLEEARVLLRDTDLPIEAVGARAGYHGLPYFSLAFKKAEGLSPAAYRARLRQESNAENLK